MKENPWLIAVVGLMSGGGWVFLQGIVQSRDKDFRHGTKDGARQADQVDASILAIARARDELEEENVRLRKNHAKDREEWERKESRMQAEVERMRQLIEEERAAATMRYDALLAQLKALQEQVKTGRKEVRE